MLVDQIQPSQAACNDGKTDADVASGSVAAGGNAVPTVASCGESSAAAHHSGQADEARATVCGPAAQSSGKRVVMEVGR